VDEVKKKKKQGIGNTQVNTLPTTATYLFHLSFCQFTADASNLLAQKQLK